MTFSKKKKKERKIKKKFGLSFPDPSDVLNNLISRNLLKRLPLIDSSSRSSARPQLDLFGFCSDKRKEEGKKKRVKGGERENNEECVQIVNAH